MLESDFEKHIKEADKVWNNWEPEKLQEGIHPYFPNYSDSEWIYPPKPTFQAVFLFGQLKSALSSQITGFEMALEVCVKTDVDDVVFIDIAVWYNGEKHAIEVHGDTKPMNVIDKKTESLLPYKWNVHHVFNSQIENDEFLKLVLNGLVTSITRSNADDIENIS